MSQILRNLFVSTLAAAAGLAIMLGVVAAFGYPPAAVARGFLRASLGGGDRIAATLLASSPLMLTGLAVCIAFRCGVWNIGAEGQYLLGALASAALGVHASGWPAWLALPTTLLAAACAGAIWAGLAAWLKLARGVQEVLATILLNFVAIQAVAMAVRGPLADPTGAARDSTPDVAAACRLPLLASRAGLHAGILIALFAAAVMWFFLAHTTWGLRIRIVGGNPIAARFARLPVARYAAATFLLSGAIAGLAGGVELTGNTYYLTANYGAGYGYTAIAVAMLARLSPLGVVPAALFFALLDTGVRGLQNVDIPGLEAFPTTLTFVAQGIVVLMIALLAGPPRKSGDT